VFHILVGEKVVTQSFNSIEQARQYMQHYHIHGQVIDEQILNELRENSQQEHPRNRSSYSTIKRPYSGRERNVHIPTCRPATTGHNVRQYQPINPRFTPKKSYLGRRRRVEE